MGRRPLLTSRRSCKRSSGNVSGQMVTQLVLAEPEPGADAQERAAQARR